MKISNHISEEKSINNRVSQGCPLLPTLFNIYMNEMISKWNQTYSPNLTKLNTLLFVNDQVNMLIQKITYNTECSKRFWDENICRKIQNSIIFRTRSSTNKIVINKYLLLDQALYKILITFDVIPYII